VLIDLPTVDLVENLHEDKGIENHGVMETVVMSPWLIRPPELDAEDEASTKEEN
jgi:hypothetical protein